MTDTEKENLIYTLAKKCSDQMKLAGYDNLSEHKKLLDRYEKQIKPIGVSRIEFMVTIGRLNGQLKDWSQE